MKKSTLVHERKPLKTASFLLNVQTSSTNSLFLRRTSHSVCKQLEVSKSPFKRSITTNKIEVINNSILIDRGILNVSGAHGDQFWGSVDTAKNILNEVKEVLKDLETKYISLETREIKAIKELACEKHHKKMPPNDLKNNQFLESTKFMSQKTGFDGFMNSFESLNDDKLAYTDKLVLQQQENELKEKQISTLQRQKELLEKDLSNLELIKSLKEAQKYKDELYLSSVETKTQQLTIKMSREHICLDKITNDLASAKEDRKVLQLQNDSLIREKCDLAALVKKLKADLRLLKNTNEMALNQNFYCGS